MNRWDLQKYIQKYLTQSPYFGSRGVTPTEYPEINLLIEKVLRTKIYAGIDLTYNPILNQIKSTRYDQLYNYHDYTVEDLVNHIEREIRNQKIMEIIK